MTPRRKAERRIADDPRLGMYADILLYDWPEGGDHWVWVATAPLAEILDWAAGIRQNEQEEQIP